ncbi:MAG: putative sporulation protein [Pseudobdellovibrio sp.]|nr:putative sporulation protein [Pseudobdellovibrio sp.]
MANLTPELEAERKRICKIAKDCGLDCFETIFELISYDQISQFASYGGFPVRYPHWKFGMEYEQLSKSYEYGLSKIYEMVINTDPCYAYLMEGNSMMDQKLVMAHVYGHCDFFKNNIWFSKTNRKMIDQMANHATRVRRYIDRYGYDEVERFIDTCLSLENLIDRHSILNGPPKMTEPKPAINKSEQFMFKVEKSYMKNYINPPDKVADQKAKQFEIDSQKPEFPAEPVRDILSFLIHYAPLEDWQQDILTIIRDESYYFAPQGMTKTLNEGWASYWHSYMMTRHILNDSEIIDFADHHSGTMFMQMGGYNPYKVGIELFRDIEERWNKGQFGREWEQCDDVRERKNWDKKTGLGREKIFEVRKLYNDVNFIDEYLTEDFCVRNRMFVYKLNKETNQFEVDTRDFKAIKAQLLFQMTNFGQPIIKIENANFENRGELLLHHVHEGLDLQPNYMDATMQNMYKIWKRPLNLVTLMDNEPQLFRYDGTEYTRHSLGDEKKSEPEQREFPKS